MNALTTFNQFSQHPGQKDPSTLVWPPTLPIELALRTATPPVIQVEYGYTDEEWAALLHNATFMRPIT